MLNRVGKFTFFIHFVCHSFQLLLLCRWEGGRDGEREGLKEKRQEESKKQEGREST